jgi:hypothetical protein
MAARLADQQHARALQGFLDAFKTVHLRQFAHDVDEGQAVHDDAVRGGEEIRAVPLDFLQQGHGNTGQTLDIVTGKGVLTWYGRTLIFAPTDTHSRNT